MREIDRGRERKMRERGRREREIGRRERERARESAREREREWCVRGEEVKESRVGGCVCRCCVLILKCCCCCSWL